MTFRPVAFFFLDGEFDIYIKNKYICTDLTLKLLSWCGRWRCRWEETAIAALVYQAAFSSFFLKKKQHFVYFFSPCDGGGLHVWIVLGLFFFFLLLLVFVFVFFNVQHLPCIAMRHLSLASRKTRRRTLKTLKERRFTEAHVTVRLPSIKRALQ